MITVGYAILITAMVVAFIVKQGRWHRVMDFHWSYSSSSYKMFGLDFRKYLVFSSASLSLYLASVLAGVFGKRIARVLYDLIFVGTGLLFFVFMRVEGFDVFPSAIAAACFFALAFSPAIDHSYYQPEWFCYFFVMSGLTLNSHAVATQSPIMALIASFIAGISFFSKIMIVLPFALPAYLLASGVGLHIVAASFIITGSMLFLSMHSRRFAKSDLDREEFVGVHKEESGIKYILRYIFRDTIMRLGKGTWNYAAVQGSIAAIHLAGIGPLLGIALLSIFAYPTPIILYWGFYIILSLAPCVVRLKYTPLYAFMIAVFVCRNSVDLVTSSLPAEMQIVILLALLAATVALDFITVDMPSLPDGYYDKGEKVIRYLRSRVNENDTIFQNGLHTEIYYELPCKTPPDELWFADRFQLSLPTPELMEKGLGFFRREKPKYYIATNPTLNLTALEKYSGLRYRLENAEGYSIYCLDKVVEPEPVEIEDLFKFDTARSLRDRKAYQESALYVAAFRSIEIGKSRTIAVTPDTPGTRMFARNVEESFDSVSVVDWAAGEQTWPQADVCLVFGHCDESVLLAERLESEGSFGTTHFLRIEQP